MCGCLHGDTFFCKSFLIVWGRGPREPALSEVEGSKPSAGRRLFAIAAILNGWPSR